MQATDGTQWTIGPADARALEQGVCVPEHSAYRWLRWSADVHYYYELPEAPGQGCWVLAGIAAIEQISDPANMRDDVVGWHIHVDWRHVRESVERIDALRATHNLDPMGAGDVHFAYLCGATMHPTLARLRPYTLQDAFTGIEEDADNLHPQHSHDVVALERSFPNGDDPSHAYPALQVRTDALGPSRVWYPLWLRMERFYRLQEGQFYYILYYGNEEDHRLDAHAVPWNAYMPDDYTYLVEIVGYAFRPCLLLGECFAYRVRPVDAHRLQRYRDAGGDGEYWIHVAEIRQVVDMHTKFCRALKGQHAQRQMNEHKIRSDRVRAEIRMLYAYEDPL